MKVLIIIMLISILIIIFIYKSCPNLHLNNTVAPFYLCNDSKFPIINNNLKSLTIFLTSGLSNRIRTLLGFFKYVN